MKRRGWMRAWAIIWLLCSSSCATATRSPEPDPVQAVTGWYEALRDGKPHIAYRYLDAKARATTDLKVFTALYAKHKPFLVAEARRLLAWARRHPAAQTATVALGKQRLRLVKTPEGWRLLMPVGARAGSQ